MVNLCCMTEVSSLCSHFWLALKYPPQETVDLEGEKKGRDCKLLFTRMLQKYLSCVKWYDVGGAIWHNLASLLVYHLTFKNYPCPWRGVYTLRDFTFYFPAKQIQISKQ